MIKSMTQEQQNATVMRMIDECKEAKRRRVLLKFEKERIGKLLIAIGNALRNEEHLGPNGITDEQYLAAQRR